MSQLGNGVEPTPREACGQIHGLGHGNLAPEPLVGRPLERSRGEA